MTRSKTFTFDPRMFVSPPFITCPKCGQQTFGILSIFQSHYTRRCKDCLYPKGSENPAFYYLPNIEKKIIYIDQFAISNMMKILNPKTKAYSKEMDTFWINLFDKIYLLFQMQLIICPNSEFHSDESLVSEYYPSLRRMYELISHNISFCEENKIKSLQLLDYAENWISGKKSQAPEINRSLAFTDEINQWLDRFIISVGSFNEDWIDQIRKDRESIHQGFKEVFHVWQKENNLKFEDWYKREVSMYGATMIKEYFKHLVSLKNQSGINIDLMFPPTSVIMFYSLQRFFENIITSKEEALKQTCDFLRSDKIDIVPFIRIYALLAAGLARKAANGQKNPPNRGMAKYLDIVSHLLPYCDAMFIDNGCASLINENPIKDRIGFNTRIFSLNSKDDFLLYLSEIEGQASSDHILKLNEVYGNSWKAPFHSIYQEEQDI